MWVLQPLAKLSIFVPLHCCLALTWVRILISILLWAPQVETCCMTRLSYLHTRIFKRALHAASLSARCNLCMLPRCMPRKTPQSTKKQRHCGFVSLYSAFAGIALFYGVFKHNIEQARTCEKWMIRKGIRQLGAILHVTHFTDSSCWFLHRHRKLQIIIYIFASTFWYKSLQFSKTHTNHIPLGLPWA